MEDRKSPIRVNLSADENELVLQAKSGRRQAFDELYQRYKRPILTYIYRFIGNLAYAEELTQEVFVRAYINIRHFEPRAKFSSWLYRIAANLSKNFIRDSQHRKRILPRKEDSYRGGEEANAELIDTVTDKGKTPGESAQAKETERLVQEAINQLPTKLKEVVILCEIEDLSYEEAAKIIHCSPMTVGSRLWRARERLSRLLGYIRNGE